MSQPQNIKNLVTVFEMDYNTFQQKHTKTSATRSRATLLKIKKLCDTLRKNILEEAKAHTASKKVKPEVVPTPETEPATEPESAPEPALKVKRTRKAPTSRGSRAVKV